MPDDALRRALAEQPGRPLITQYDDRTGERVELSVATVENWVAKTANLLQEAAVEPGAVATVLLPAHWQTAVILLGCWRAGVAVEYSPVGVAVDDYAVRRTTAGEVNADVVFVAADRIEEAPAADEIWALSLAPMAAPLREVPKGASDYAVEVRGQGDRFTPYAPVDAAGPGLTAAGLTLADLVDRGRAEAAELGLEPGGRLLVDTDETRQPSPVGWLLAPLVANASLVLLRHPDPAGIDRIASTERITTRL